MIGTGASILVLFKPRADPNKSMVVAFSNKGYVEQLSSNLFMKKKKAKSTDSGNCSSAASDLVKL
jgi:hypothetical protein